MSERSSQVEWAEIREMFRETDAKFKETAARFEETDAKFKETDARLEQQAAKTRAEVEATSASIRRLEGLFSSQWGRMLEALVEPAALALFQQRGIDVHQVFPRSKTQRNDHTMELDLLLTNDSQVVIVEVKSTLKVSDVQDCLSDLDAFLMFFPRYQGAAIYGAVAGLTIAEEADRYAYRQGLFVLNVSGEGVVKLKNDQDFRPKNFG